MLSESLPSAVTCLLRSCAPERRHFVFVTGERTLLLPTCLCINQFPSSTRNIPLVLPMRNSKLTCMGFFIFWIEFCNKKKRYLIVHPLAGYPELLNGSNTIFPKQIKLHLQCSADYMKSAFGWVQPYRPMYLIFFDTKITVHEVALIYSS